VSETIKAKIKERLAFDEDEFRREWSARSFGMGMHYSEMQGARCYHNWIVTENLAPVLVELLRAGDSMRDELTNYYGGSKGECEWLKALAQFNLWLEGGGK
jgi:hypothetical protein